MSAGAQIPFFQKSWKFTLQTQGGQTVVLSSDQFSEPLRITFSINTRVLLAYWDANVTIYNIKPTEIQAPGVLQPWTFGQPISLADTLSISAGYRFGTGGDAFDPDANLIYKGGVFQPYWTREGVVDWKLTLRCLVGYTEDALNFLALPVAKGAKPEDVMNQVKKAAELRFENVDTANLNKTQYPRAQAITGRPFQAIQQIATDHNMQAWVSWNGLNVRSLTFDPNTVPLVTYAPPNLTGNLAPNGTQSGLIKNTLIGTPEQTQDGVTFRVLMDALPKLGDVVQIAPGTAINRIPLVPGRFPSILDKGGLYVVAGLRHVGDTRGRSDDWYTEITGLTAGFFQNFLLPSTPNQTQ